MALADEITRDLSGSAARLEVRPERIKAALARELSPRAAVEVQSLLRRRLRFFSLMALAGAGIGSSAYLAKPYWDPRPFTANWFEPSFVWFVSAVVALLTGLLWSRWPLTLGRLRSAELILFGLPVALVTWYYLDQLWFQHLLIRTFQDNYFFVPFILSTFVLYFVFLIVAYGTLIPNTGKRCGLVVTGMALVPVVVVTAVGVAEEPIRTEYLVPFLGCLSVVVVWMGVAVALAVHGSHRIEVLRREASAARQLGQYRLRERLGVGGMGEVYLAEHVLLRRPCALKLIRPEQAGDPKHLLRFEREVQATAALTHPNTVQVFDYGHTEDGTFYYAMEYLPGLNLEELVKRHGPVSPERTIHLLRQACGALHEAHAAGLIHRDIKPSNIIACERGGLHDVAKLLDFGLVRADGFGTGGDHLTQEGAIAGTPAYMSPEQANGNKDLDGRSDLYSLGAVAYYLLTGQPPFIRPTSLQTLIAHACDTPVAPNQLRAEIPPDLQAVVLRCLEKDPARRLPDARSLDTALAGCPAAGLWTEERAAAWWQDARGTR
jgi:eukaryotic-like serine/threonine-protein kinase